MAESLTFDWDSGDDSSADSGQSSEAHQGLSSLPGVPPTRALCLGGATTAAEADNAAPWIRGMVQNPVSELLVPVHQTISLDALHPGVDGVWLTGEASRGLSSAAALRRALDSLGTRRFVWESSVDVAAIAGVWAQEGSARAELALDPLGQWVSQRQLPQSFDEALADVADVLVYGMQHAPSHRPLYVSTLHVHEAGAAVADELAYALSSGLTYLRRLAAMGLEANQLATQMRFGFGMDGDVFVGMAKLRAFRWLWGKLLSASSVVCAEQAPVIHARVSSRGWAAFDPHLNLLRSTNACFAAINAGAQWITGRAFDGLSGEPSALAERLIANEGLMLRHEAHLGQCVDPAGGSFYVESLTESLAREGWRRFRALEADGGIPAVLLNGSFQDHLADSAEERRETFEKGGSAVVGVHVYPTAKVAPLADAVTPEALVFEGDEAQSWRREGAPLGGLMNALAASDKDRVRLRNELYGAARSESLPAMPALRDAESLERLRLQVEALPHEIRQVCVMGVGAPKVMKPKLEWASMFLRSLGMRVDEAKVISALSEALESTQALPQTVALGLSDLDDTAAVHEAVARLRSHGVSSVLCVGRMPASCADVFVADIYRGCDVRALLARMGMPS